LIVDEWGNLHDVEPGTNPGFLYQQNTMRDAIVAALNLNIFNNHSDRVRMANIAQVVNVLQSVILTDNEKMILTPTYHVFDLYKVHQNAVLLPIQMISENYALDGKNIPALHATASSDSSGIIHINIVNVHPQKQISVMCMLKGITIKNISGKILTAATMQAHNTFDQPNNVAISEFDQFKSVGGEITIEVPSKSIISLEIVRK
jgi:alpha-L-arabinofuranosidase